jgi:hypothetical protein
MNRSILASLTCLATLGFATDVLAGERPGLVSAARECPQYGPGFVQVPGTATCVRVGGRVTSEYGTSTRRSTRGAGFGSSGRVAVDTRTDTAYGLLRTYVRVRAGSGSALDR